jgi:N-acetylmuramoyl-L-alanine amidase
MSELNLFLPIAKVDADKRLVYGIATAEVADRAGEICDYESTNAGAVRWFANRHSQVSAHIVLKEDGSEATQMVPFAKKAWHACDYNSRSIGLEMAGFAKTGYGESEWRAAASIVAWLLHKYQIPARWAQHGEGPGFCSHFDLGAAGGGHCDPTTDGVVWAGFVARVQDASARGFLPEWGCHDSLAASPAPAHA